MKTEIDLSAIESALIQLGEATARQIADETGLEAKDVTRTFNTMLKSATVEREKRGSEYVYWLTTTAATKPTAKPRAAAAAVYAALEGGTDPMPDLAAQLREAHAERLAMSQTIISICCAIGRDPGQTTTAELPQALRDYIDAKIEREKAEQAGAIADIRAAIGDDGRLTLSEIAGKVKETLIALGLDSYVLDVIRNTLASHAADLVPDCGSITTEPEAIRIMAQLIDAQHSHLHAQSMQIESLADELEAQAATHQAETGLLADKNAKLHAEIQHLRSQPTPTAGVAADPIPDAFFVLRHDWKRHVSRHKSREAAERTATSALRAGAGQADIYAVKRVAIGKRHPVIQSV